MCNKVTVSEAYDQLRCRFPTTFSAMLYMFPASFSSHMDVHVKSAHDGWVVRSLVASFSVIITCMNIRRRLD